jgi:predicted transcriptional regulator
MVHYLKIKTEICNRIVPLLLFLTLSAFFYSCLPVKASHANCDYLSIGTQIKKQRIKKGYSVKELANAVKMSEQSLLLVEKGLATPIYSKLISLQELLNAEFVLTN